MTTREKQRRKKRRKRGSGSVVEKRREEKERWKRTRIKERKRTSTDTDTLLFFSLLCVYLVCGSKGCDGWDGMDCVVRFKGKAKENKG